MEFKDRLKELMIEKNINQVELSKEIDFAQRTISMWLLGQTEPKQTALTRLAQFFGCSLDYLVGLEDDFGNVAVNINANLSAEEKTLLELFNKLPEVRRKTIIDTMHFMVESNNQANTQNRKFHAQK